MITDCKTACLDESELVRLPTPALRAMKVKIARKDEQVSEKERQRGLEFARSLRSLPEKDRLQGNRVSLEQAKTEHDQFSSKFGQGLCYLCGAPVASFDRAKPCAHWLLNPKGFKKSDFPSVTKKFGFFQLESYLRWVANEDNFARNINDLKDEGTGKLLESTIRYKDLEWAFSCSESDYLGHATTQHAKHAHYHFQMRIRGYSFIKYNDFHIPFKNTEIHRIEAMRALPDFVERHSFFGAGMNDDLTDATAEYIVKNTVGEGNYDDAPFKLDTLIVADEGTTISGDALADLIAEAKAKNVTVASLAHKLSNVSVQVHVSPGPGVVEQAARSGGRRKDSSSDEGIRLTTTDPEFQAQMDVARQVMKKRWSVLRELAK